MSARMDAFRQALRELCAQHHCILQTDAGVEIAVCFHDMDPERWDPLEDVTLVEDRL